MDSPQGRAVLGSAARAGLCALVGFWIAAAGAEPANAQNKIYSFRDANGVLHFSNVPSDPRYRLMVERPQPFGFRLPQRPPDIDAWDSLIDSTARANSLRPGLIKAVIAAESGFDPRAVSQRGAQGLMQLMPGTASDLGVSDPLHPIQNVRGGTRYLRQMIDRFGRLEHALAAYNAGPQTVERYRGIPPYAETRDYVKRVLAYYRDYDDDFAR